MSARSRTPGRLAALADLCLALALVLAAGSAAPLVVAGFAPASGLIGVVVAQGVVILAGLALLCYWRGVTFTGLGLVAPGWRDVLRGVQLLVVVFAVNILLRLFVMQLFPDAVSGQLARITELGNRVAGGIGVPELLGLSLFIGLYEELLARGFLLQRARALLGGLWGPVLLSSLLFGLGHVYQGAFGVIQTALVGAILAVAVLRYASLWPAIIAHALINAVSLWVLAAT
ncbi:hypothetical protein KBTX_00615 [wastewater metagenome]|uniref:CAAX prenyl protease 2/Lysostaphin resistance protein A-like domain-containing protein n=3 Tax=root TaxID=1 RepID=A0A5B8RC90_9ZZZZ|nr:hypothetical protein KBTEX_00615 [uncultured organism]